jgi:dienelactone hydrolase
MPPSLNAALAGVVVAALYPAHTCSVLAQPAPSPAPTFGPFSVNSTWYKVPALDSTDPEAFVVYPSNGTGPFPLISYVHGLAGGDIDLLGYTDLFAQIASYGFVVVAPDSCDFGCTSPSRGSPWSDCGGLPDVIPNATLWAPWYAEGLKLIDWARNMTEGGEDPIFRLVDWSRGVGYAGHSMGGQAGVIAANPACTSRYNISAVVLHHPASAVVVNTNFNMAKNISVPTALFTSSGDGIWPDSEAIKNATTYRPFAYRNEQGWSHLEPVLLPPIENPLLATFTAAWFKIYVAGDDSWRAAIYGSGPGSLCGEAPQVECWAEES